MDNSSILVIPDLQEPYGHPDAIPFLKEIKKQFKPTRTISVGDMEDYHCFNFHGQNPSLPSAADELIMLRKKIKELSTIFPVMDILASNHGALPYRKAASVGIPKELLKDERSILQAPLTWKWHGELFIRLPNGIRLKIVHNYSANVLQSAKDQGCSLIQGHYHSRSELHWFSNGRTQNFAMNVGCLIDDSSAAFDYNKTQAKRPVLTAAVIKNGIPILIPMICQRDRWVGWL